MSLVCLLPWPGMIGYRRFYQGVLIKAKNNKRVAAGTVIRLMAMSICAYLSFNQKLLDGASVATLSLSAGVCAEALFIRMASRTRVRELISKRDIQTESKLTLPGVWTFYYPLALTAIIGLTVQPLITFGMGKALFPLESLAVLPVVNSLVFFFRAIPLSFQEVVITLVGEHESNRKSLQDFAIGLGAALTIILGTLTFTPLADLWFRQIAGLPEDLAKFAWAPLAIAIAVPALSLLLCWQRSILIHDKNTKPVTYASAIELIMVTLALGIGILGGAPYSGVTLAMVSLVIGRISSTTFLKARHKV